METGSGIELVKAKAHTSALDIARCLVSFTDRRGNIAADLAAKEALQHHQLPQEALEGFEELGETIKDLGR